MLSVVMPAFNESDALEPAVRDLVRALRERDAEAFEVLVVENGSTDDTRARAERLVAELPEVSSRSLPDPDYGGALREGLLAARGDTVVLFDVDYYDVDFLDRARTEVEAGAAIVVASKRAPGANDTRGRARRLVTATFTALLRLLFGLRVSDTHGMKLAQRTPVEPLVRECRFGTDLFDTELVIRAERAGLRVAEVPVTVRETRPSRTPIWKRVPRTVWGLVRLRVVLLREARARR